MVVVGALIINITLGKEFERRITEKVSDGLYTSASEVIRDGLGLLFEKDVVKKQQHEILREEVAKGFEQLINEEQLVLLNERQELLTQYEAELAQNFNLHISPESKIDLFV